jgi:hypothetical protein
MQLAQDESSGRLLVLEQLNDYQFLKKESTVYDLKMK